MADVFSRTMGEGVLAVAAAPTATPQFTFLSNHFYRLLAVSMQPPYPTHVTFMPYSGDL